MSIIWTAPVPRPLWRQPVALIALGWLSLVSVGAIAAPIIAPAGPLAANVSRSLQAPSADAVLGTDFMGRDILSRLVWGGRWTLGTGLAGLAIAVGVGFPIGLTAGFFGGRTETATMRVADALLAFPGLLLALALTALFGPGIKATTIAIGLAAAPAYARVTRSVVAEIRAQTYIEAARALGASDSRLLMHHILPNAAAPLIAFAAVQLGWVLLNSAALNFLGLGAPPGTPEWGAMLAEGRDYLRDAPWASLFPGLALTLTVLAANLIGDGIQEALRAR